MRPRFEFCFHTIAPDAAANGDVDPSLALLGSQGWEIRATTALHDGGLSVALQRPLDEDTPLPDAPALSATLAQPLAAPSPEELGGVRTQRDSGASARGGGAGEPVADRGVLLGVAGERRDDRRVAVGVERTERRVERVRRRRRIVGERE
jgi:hypothetical protein